MYLGSFNLHDYITFTCNTHNPTNGSAVDADAVPLFHIYKDEGSNPILTGTMSLLNGNNTVGFYSEQFMVTGTVFERRKSYSIYIQAVVASVTGTMSHSFQVGSYVLDVENPITAGNVTGSVLGNVNGSVGSVVSPVGINTGTFLNALADAVWDEALAGHLAAGQAGYTLASRMPTGTVIVSSNLDKTGYSLSSPQTYDRIGYTSGTMTAVLNVINPVTAGNVTGSVLGNINGSVNSVTQPVGISTGTLLDAMADKVWDEQLSGHLADGAAGHTVFSRMPTGTVVVGSNQDKTGYSLSSPQNFDLVGNISGTLSNVLNVINPVTAGNVTGSVLGNVNGSVTSVTNPVGLNTGTLISSIADGVWDEQLSGHLQAGSTGEKLNTGGDPWGIALPGIYTAGQAGHILASRMPTGTVIVGQNNDKLGYSLASPQAFDLIGNISGTLTNVLNVVYPVVAGSVTGSILGNVNGSVASVTNPVGINTGSFIGAIADGVWDEQIASHLSAGSTGEKLNAASSAGDPWTTSLPGSYVAGQAGYILASRMPTGTVIVGQNNDKTGYGLATGSLLEAIADTVWDEQLGGHLVTGSAGRRLNDAADGGSDPWATSLPALYTSGQAGYILGTNLDARVSSRMASGTVSVAGLNPALLDVAVSSRLASGTFATNYTTPPTANENADALLKRDWTGVTGEAARSVLNALRFIRNKFSTQDNPGFVTVYKEDDTTEAYQKPLTTDASAEPIVEG